MAWRIDDAWPLSCVYFCASNIGISVRRLVHLVFHYEVDVGCGRDRVYGAVVRQKLRRFENNAQGNVAREVRGEKGSMKVECRRTVAACSF